MLHPRLSLHSTDFSSGIWDLRAIREVMKKKKKHMREIAITFMRDPRNNSQLVRHREATSTLAATKSQVSSLRSAVCFSQQRYKSPYRAIKPCKAVNVKFAKAFTRRRWIPDGDHRRQSASSHGRKRARKRGSLRHRGTFSRKGRCICLIYRIFIPLARSLAADPNCDLTSNAAHERPQSFKFVSLHSACARRCERRHRRRKPGCIFSEHLPRFPRRCARDQISQFIDTWTRHFQNEIRRRRLRRCNHVAIIRSYCIILVSVSSKLLSYRSLQYPELFLHTINTVFRKFQQSDLKPVAYLVSTVICFRLLYIVLPQNLHLMCRASNVRTQSIEGILFNDAI